jgi:hypothetical protein
MASGHLRAPQQQAGQMAAPTSLHHRPKIPCQQGAVHRWLISAVLKGRRGRLLIAQLPTLKRECRLSQIIGPLCHRHQTFGGRGKMV